jgi:hypothetical protein
MAKKSDTAILLKAADILKERGHAKSVLCDRRTGRVCLLGAIHVAFSGDPYWPANYQEPQRLLGKVASYLARKLKWTSADPQEAVIWNNKRKTTKADVIAALRGAAKAAAR